MRKIQRIRRAEKILSCNGKRIIRYAIAVIMAAMFVNCDNGNASARNREKRDTVFDARLVTPIDYDPARESAKFGVCNDTNPIQVIICEKLLDECVRCGILDNGGIRAYERIRRCPSVSWYMELVDECEKEDIFYDTVGGGDTWCDYCEYVLAPRGKCCPD